MAHLIFYLSKSDLSKSEATEKQSCCSCASGLLVVGLLHNCFVAGLIFGWPALAHILTSEGQFSELCDFASINITNTSDVQDVKSCSASQVALADCYIAGSTATFLAYLPFGIIVDKIGPKASSAVGTTFGISGCILLAFADSKSFNVFAVALILVGFGGPGHHMSIFHLSNLKLKIKGLVITLVVSTFTLSGIIFVVIQVLFLYVGLSRSLLFGCLAGILGVFLLLGLFLWPNKVFLPGDMVKARKSGELKPGYKGHWSHPFYSVKSASVKSVSVKSVDANKKKKKITEGRIQSIVKPKKESAGLCGCGEIWEACRTKNFIGINIFFVLTNFSYNFFVGTASQQLLLKGDNGDLLSAFAIILPAGVVFLPLISCILDRFTYFGLFIMMTAIVTTGVMYGTILLIPNLEVMIAQFIVLSFHRQALYTSTYAFIAAKFDFRLYGRLSGTTVLCGGVATLFSYVLLIVVEAAENFFYVNVGLLCSALCTAFFPLYVGYVACKYKKETQETTSDSS